LRQRVCDHLFVALPGEWPDTVVEALGRSGALRLGVGHRQVELGPDLAGELGRCRAEGVTGWAVVRSPADVEQAAAHGAHLWLAGYEAGGATVSCHTALTLIRAAVTTGCPWVVEGLGLRGMAAALAVGASGVVVGPQLWATRNSPLPEATKAALADARSGRDSILLGDGRSRVRVFGRTAQAAQRARRLAPVDAASLLEGWTQDPEVPCPAPASVADASLFVGMGTLEAFERLVAILADRVAAARRVPATDQDPLGTGQPVVQGPMANVSEGTALSVAVARCGGLPFAALGALRPDEAVAVLRQHATAGHPWGVGVIGFDVMPHRDAHLEAVARLERPPSAVILAGGSVALAIKVRDMGLRPWLHTPSRPLAASALAEGVPIVLEGHEAGGHVGMLSSATLWEEGLAAAEARGSGLVVLAGGIGDAVSAAFAFAMAAEAVEAGVELALQAGTAFFFTHEIVEGSQITSAYQASALSAVETVLVGESVRLALRCAPNDFTHATKDLERRLVAEGVARSERRLRIEHHNLGRTRIAAKGIERSPETFGARYRPVSVPRQTRQGAFTMGQGATVTRRLTTVAELIDELTLGASALVRGAAPTQRGVVSVPGRPTAQEVSRPAQRVVLGAEVAPRGAVSAKIAIVGFGAVLPGALDAPTFWQNLVEGRSAIAPVPEERWSTARYHDPAASTQGPVKTYTRLAGAVQGHIFDGLRYRIPPRVVRTLDPSQRLALAASDEAIGRAGWQGMDGRRAAVVIGNAMGGEFAKSLALRVRFREVLAALAQDEELEDMSASARAALFARVEQRLAAGLPPVEVDSMAGLLSNVVAGRVASWLDWMGGNLTVDAACAASLAALSVAVDWLRTGRCDAVLAGGVDTDLSPETFVGFCRTAALSARGSRPFSSEADGFIMGEGAAIFALKRLDDALADGDPVWAVLAGIGQSSDGRGRSITAPRPEGQKAAIRRAFASVDFSATDVGLVEAHGTGTPLGDRTEASVLASVFAGRRDPVWLGSVKSMIGHLKGAAGAAGMLKATLSVATGIVPPTLGAAPLHPDLPVRGHPFRLPRFCASWDDPIRRAGVSAFGFGGTNFHALLEQAPPEARRPDELAAWQAQGRAMVRRRAGLAVWTANDRTTVVHCFGAEDRAALRQEVAACRTQDPACASADACRLFLVAPEDQADAARERALAWLGQDAPQPAPPGVFLGAGMPLRLGLLAPGQGSQRKGSLASVGRLAAGAAALAEMEAHFEGMPSDESADPADLHRTLVACGVAWIAVLRAAGVALDSVAGHSLGELAGLYAAGRLEGASLARVAVARGQALSACPEGAMAAVAGSAARVGPLCDAFGVSVAATNTPDETVVAGSTAAIAALVEGLVDRGLRGKRLVVERGYHSRCVEGAVQPLEASLQDVPWLEGQLPCLRGLDGEPFGPSPAEGLVGGLTRPVRFGEVLTALRERGVQAVLELGPGRTLSRFAEAAGLEAVALDPRPDRDEAGVVRAAARLGAMGHPGLLLSLPGNVAVVAHAAAPSPEPASLPQASSAVQPRRVRAAKRLQDLRILALADPSHQPAYEAARAALLGELAADDLAGIMAGGPTGVIPPGPPVRPPAKAQPVGQPATAAPPLRPEPPKAEAPDVRAAVVQAIVEVTGYPADFLSDEADLEGELGIDSIRKMEILGLLQDRLGFTTAEADYAELGDANLAALVAYTESRIGQATDGATTPESGAAHLHRLVRVPLDAVTATAEPVLPGCRPQGGTWVRWARGGSASDEVARWRTWSVAALDAPPGRIVVVRDEGCPAGAAALGFARCLGRRWRCAVREIVVDGPVEPAEVGAECAAPSRPESVVLTPGSAAQIWRLPWSVEAGSTGWDRPVVLASGGLGGITMACLAELASLDARVLVLGRTPATELETEALNRPGLELHHRCCDVTVASEVAAAADWARGRWGRIDVVVHGAGTLADGRVEDLTDEAAARVLGVKLLGARNLAQATAQDAPALWVSFSSLVAHVGNSGQTVYAAANLALEAFAHPTAARSLSLAWTAWSEVGMASRTGALGLLAALGIRPLSPREGARAFGELVASTASGSVLVAAQPMLKASEFWPLGALSEVSDGVISASIPLDPSTAELADHQVAGRPLVPAALWLCAVQAAARLAGMAEVVIEDFHVEAPTFVPQSRCDARLRMERAVDGRWKATIHTASALVARGLVQAGRPVERAERPRPLAGGRPATPLYQPHRLFHGPHWRVLRQVERGSNGDSRADLHVPDALGPLAAAFDGAHQLLAAWCEGATGSMGLPVGADRWEIGATARGCRSLRLESHATPDGAAVRGDVVATDPDGRVVLRGFGVRLARARGSVDA
jgi:acyl transferase domain-containing protein/NAD(P)H-dependent flavin oxidoreductase YrpB (nitropropane dioxygenase family)/acyl carrier protein